MPLGKVGGDPEVHEARDDDSSRLETDREEGEARNGSQGLATLGLSESSSPNIGVGEISVGCAVERGRIDERSRLCRRLEEERSYKDIRGIIEFLETTSVCGDSAESDRADVEAGRFKYTRLNSWRRCRHAERRSVPRLAGDPPIMHHRSTRIPTRATHSLTGALDVRVLESVIFERRDANFNPCLTFFGIVLMI